MSAIWLVTGIQGAGKSTIADLLAQRFERGVHVRGGEFYRWGVRGWVQPGSGDDAARLTPDETVDAIVTRADEACVDDVV